MSRSRYNCVSYKSVGCGYSISSLSTIWPIRSLSCSLPPPEWWCPGTRPPPSSSTAATRPGHREARWAHVQTGAFKSLLNLKGPRNPENKENPSLWWNYKVINFPIGMNLRMAFHIWGMFIQIITTFKLLSSSQHQFKIKLKLMLALNWHSLCACVTVLQLLKEIVRTLTLSNFV